MAKSLTPKGFEIYPYKDEFQGRAAGALGLHRLMWATDSKSKAQLANVR